MSSIPLLDAPSISIRSKKFPESIDNEISEFFKGSPSFEISELRALAKILAVEVFPTPLGPVSR